MWRCPSRSWLHHRFLAHDRCAGSCLTTRSCMNQTQDELDALPTLRSRSPCASWAPPRWGFVREVPLAFTAPHYSAREGCPGHCATLFYEADFQQIGVTFFMPQTDMVQCASQTTWFREHGAHPSEAAHMFKLILLLPFPADWFHSHNHTLG